MQAGGDWRTSTLGEQAYKHVPQHGKCDDDAQDLRQGG
jgi:hypothetical protein